MTVDEILQKIAQAKSDFEALEAKDQLHKLILDEVIGKNDKRIRDNDYQDYTFCSNCDQIIGDGEEYSKDCRCTVKNRLRAKQRQSLDKLFNKEAS